MSYNVENLFDTYDDPLTIDEEFTPKGARHWTKQKFEIKIARIAKVIAAVGEGRPPFLIGLCEIENESVLKTLTEASILKNFSYKFKHFESPDPRGVDVGLLYQQTIFTPIEAKAVPVRYVSGRATRDILYVSGTIFGADTLHVFVCHFPSRLGGAAASEPKRCRAAEHLKQKTDSLFSQNKNAKIVIMGDFNDYPNDRALREVLQAQNPQNVPAGGVFRGLYNMAAPIEESGGVCSHKFQGQWGMLDHIIVSAALLSAENGLRIPAKSASVFAPDFLLENDAANMGKMPKRTFVGSRYNDGFSDHLPVFIDFNF